MAARPGSMAAGPAGGVALPGMTGEHDSVPPGPPGCGGESSQSPSWIFSNTRDPRDRVPFPLWSFTPPGFCVTAGRALTSMGSPLDAGRRIAGLLGYNPGPGLYSRMTRAVEGMPKVIRTQELPGLLRKYPEGVPGWEVASVAPALEGVQSIPRQDLLDLIQQHSPAYTHGELLLQGKMEPRPLIRPEGFFLGASPGQLTGMRPLGRGVPVGDTKFQDYGQGGDNYGELLLVQPGADGTAFGSHWNALPGGMLRARAANSAVAHARFDTHGDALRINELQSDLGIHNRKAREAMADFIAGQPVATQRPSPELPFPLEDAWADILIKRLALEAARGGHRAIEVASPRAIADKVGGNIDNYEHFYGKVVPGAIERLGRKMGGLVEDSPPAAAPGYNALAEKIAETFPAGLNENDNLIDAVSHIVRDTPGPGDALRHAVQGLEHAYVMHPSDVGGNAEFLYSQIQRSLMARGESAEDAARLAASQMPRILRMAEDNARRRAAYTRLRALGEDQEQLPKFRQYRAVNPGRRYIMSDEMRKRILEGGIGLSVLGGLSAQEE